MDWHVVVVDGVTYHWTSYPSRYRIDDGPVVPCIALGVALQPDAGGGLGASFSPDKIVTEADAVALVREFLRANRGPFPGTTRPPCTSLVPFSFAARYEDSAGRETIEVRVVPRNERNGTAGYRFETTLRGVAFGGADLDTFSAVDPTAPTTSGFPTEGYALSGELPCVIALAGARIHTPLHFSLDSRRPSDHLTVRITVAGETCEVVDSWFEDALLRLDRALPAGARLVACVTCLFSDYSPYGHGLTGMSCHRGEKARYLAVRTKLDYFAVPTTEEVMETHLCDEYQPRVPGTGYRG